MDEEEVTGEVSASGKSEQGDLRARSRASLLAMSECSDLSSLSVEELKTEITLFLRLWREDVDGYAGAYGRILHSYRRVSRNAFMEMSRRWLRERKLAEKLAKELDMVRSEGAMGAPLPTLPPSEEEGMPGGERRLLGRWGLSLLLFPPK